MAVIRTNGVKHRPGQGCAHEGGPGSLENCTLKRGTLVHNTARSVAWAQMTTAEVRRRLKGRAQTSVSFGIRTHEMPFGPGSPVLTCRRVTAGRVARGEQQHPGS